MIGRDQPQDPFPSDRKKKMRTKSHCELELGNKNIHWSTGEEHQFMKLL